jgi:N-carbamoylputrescine amidase
MKCSAIALFALFAADVVYGDAPEKAAPPVAQVQFAGQAGRKPHEKGLRIAGIVLKWIRADKEANFRRVEPMIRQAAAGGAQIVCTTECFLDGYAIADKSIPLDVYRSLGEPIPEGAYFKRLAALARELKIVLVAGMLEADGEARCNTAALISPEGALLGKYRKQHLEHELEKALTQ